MVNFDWSITSEIGARVHEKIRNHLKDTNYSVIYWPFYDSPEVRILPKPPCMDSPPGRVQSICTICIKSSRIIAVSHGVFTAAFSYSEPDFIDKIIDHIGLTNEESKTEGPNIDVGTESATDSDADS